MLDTIKVKMESAYVAAAKYLIGYSEIGKATAVFDSDFESYVQNWQRVSGLTPDGVIGKASWTKIAAAAPTVSTAKNKKSAAVCALQTLLNIDADGIFGKKTKAAVAAFQSTNSLVSDGICGQKTWSMLICGTASASAEGRDKSTFIQPPNFKQYDSRWGKKMYSNHGDTKQTMASSACGPTSMADIVAQWWDVNITPYDLAQKSMSWGTRSYNSGTTAAFFKKVAELYGASKYLPTKSIQNVISCLLDGGYVIVCFGAGTKGKSSYQKWTKGGHYCCIWGYDGKYFYINDPASSSSSRAKGTYDEVLDARKGFYCFYK